MKGDFSRFTYRRDRHYNGVRMQQGRVQLDADWNEQVDILAHLRHTQARDVIGATGVPHERGGFLIAAATDDLSISDGRIYVDGILVENESTVLYKAQPYYPVPADWSLDSGLYLVYLDVWQRHIAALELPQPDDRAIRDVALGGPDTATRTQVIWQTRLLRVGAVDSLINCWDVPTAWTDLVTRQHGRMSAQTKAPETEPNPCSVPASAGYRRLENQLYRVEIHDRGAAGTATFKWSRDNGMVVTRLLEVDGTVLSVADAGRDEVLGFARGQWAEVNDEARLLRGEPGVLVSIADVVENTIEIDAWPSAITDPDTDFDLATATVRRWDHVSDIDPETEAATGTVAVVEDSWVDLESGVQVSFDGSAEYETGDYWLIPARTVSSESQGGDIEWPPDPDNAEQPAWLLPQGIDHDYARLALVTWDDGAFTLKHDCRLLIPALTEPDLYYISGDGQEAMPGDTLPQVLSVGVSNCNRSIEGAWVRFDLHKEGASGDGTLSVLPGTVATRIHSTDSAGKWLILATDEVGEAACVWQLQSRATLEPAVGDEAPTLPAQQVRATLLLNPADDDQDKLDRPVVFSASFGVASENQYGGSDFPDIQYPGNQAAGGLQVETVEDALDQLRQNVALYYVGGDGQEAKRNYEPTEGGWEILRGQLSHPLVVRAANGDWPFRQAKVKFQITGGNGSIQPAAGFVPQDQVTGVDGRTTEFVILTDTDGVVGCLWEIGEPVGSEVGQQVTATLVETLPAGTDNFIVLPSQIRFHAFLSLADEVSYDGSDFPDLTHESLEVHTVEAALDQLRENTALHYVGGDGQETYPGLELAQPLQVRVANGQWPRAEAEVQFRIVEDEEGGDGPGVLTAGPVTGSSVTVTSGLDGVAECYWTPNADGETSQTVIARLITPRQLDEGLASVVRFHTQLRRADEIYYEPNDESLEVPPPDTVQRAIDELYRMKVNRVGDLMTGDLGINARLAVEQDVSIGYHSEWNTDGILDFSETEGHAVVRVNGGMHVGGATDPGDDNLKIDGTCTIDGDCTIHGNLIVIKQPTVSVERQQVEVDDNIIVVNKYDIATLPGGTTLPLDVDAGLEVFRGGTEPNASLIWDEGDDVWKIGRTGDLHTVSDDRHRHSALYLPNGAGSPVLGIDSNGNVGVGNPTPQDRLDVANGGLLVRGNRILSGLGDSLVFNGDWQFGLDGIKPVIGNTSQLQTVPITDSPVGGKALQVSGYVAFVMSDLIPFDQDATYVFDIVARQQSDPSTGGKGFWFGGAGYLQDGSTFCNISGANTHFNQHYVAVSGTPLPGGWTRYIGYLRGIGASGTFAARNDPANPGVFQNGVRYFRPIAYVNYSDGNGMALIASVRVHRLHNFPGADDGGQAVTGVVEFANLPLNQEMVSNDIDPGFGPAAVCVQLGVDAAAGSATSIADSGYRDILYRANVDRTTGRFRIFVRRSIGGTATVRLRWWAIKPRAGETTATVAIGISVSPPSVILGPGGTTTFTATVSGTTNTGVSWSTNGGSITPAGVYTAPTTAGSFIVTAASVADPNKKANATVTVVKPKDIKEKEKDLKEKDLKEKDIVDGPVVLVGKGPTGLELKSDAEFIAPAVVDGSAVAGSLAIGRAFITPDERPDLSQPPGTPNG